MKMKFTDRSIAALKPKTERYEVWDTANSAFGIRVGKTGRKSWILLYRFGGRSRRMTLDDYPAMSLSKARIAAAQARDAVKDGRDPGSAKVAENEAERTADTVAELAAEYMEHHAHKKKRASSAAEDQRLIDVEVLPSWQNLKAKEIKRRDIMSLLDRIEKRPAPVTRNRTAALISKMFGFGVNRGILDASPAVGIERLPEKSRDRFLSAAEIRSFWNGLDAADMDRRTALAIRFALVTGQRRSEVAGIPWSEVDLTEKLWRLPGTRTKNGRPNIIPLPPLAMAIIKEAESLRVRTLPTRPNRKDRRPYDPTPSPWLFASRIGDKPLEPAALTRAFNRNRKLLGVGDATVHDLRRSFATWHGELGTAPEILKALMNHAPEGVTEAVYNRAELIEPRRKTMAVWCAWLKATVAAKAAHDGLSHQ